MPRRLDPASLRAALLAAGPAPRPEIALLDLRPLGRYSQGHILLAVSHPCDRLEIGLAELLPRRSVPVVLCDDGDGLAERAAARMADWGFGDIAVLDGGAPGWAAAGYELFSGVNVYSKAFGEAVEHACHTPSITAAELKRRIDGGTDLVVLDSRPFDEYHRMNIPGAIDCPGAELAYRVHDIAPSPDTLVVVNCAGRTRSIIGAQSLINAGIANRVAALANGTMGWQLSGYPLESGQTRRAPEVTETGFDRAVVAAARIGARFEIEVLDKPTLDAWRADGDRTLHLLDVRDPEEFAAGHYPGSVSAPGGQLVQATDRWVATIGARLVVIDDNGVRATMTAAWLTQMGLWQVAVFGRGLARSRAALEAGPSPVTVFSQDAGPGAAPPIAVARLQSLVDAGRAVVVDLAASPAYRAGHIQGAWFATRGSLAAAIAHIKPMAGATVVLTSEDGVIARLAAGDASRAWPGALAVLDGGTAAWRAAGLPLEPGDERMAAAPDDVWLKPYERGGDQAAAMQGYLDWETALPAQIARDGLARFHVGPSPR